MSGVTHRFLLKRSQVEIGNLGGQKPGSEMQHQNALLSDRARALLLSFAISHNASDFCRFITVVALREFGASSAYMVRVEAGAKLRTVGQYGQPRADESSVAQNTPQDIAIRQAIVDKTIIKIEVKESDKDGTFIALPFSPNGEATGALGMAFRQQGMEIPEAELELLQLLSELIAVNSLPRIRATGLLSKLYFDQEDLEEVSAITHRQLEILDEMAIGKTNYQIAQALRLSESTIKQESVRIFRILGVNSRQRAVSIAKEMGLI
jgi:DNA-binding CsgD family transcriptional regulator